MQNDFPSLSFSLQQRRAEVAFRELSTSSQAEKAIEWTSQNNRTQKFILS